MTKRKILISPGYGVGWTSWCSCPEVSAFMLEYEPIIKFLEEGNKFSKEFEPKHQLLTQFKRDVIERFGEDKVPYLGGARDLEVRAVFGRVRINEYDGYESIEEEGQYSEWM